MELGICSYSFHRTLAAQNQDVLQFIVFSQRLGCTRLDPWNAHLPVVKQGDAAIPPGVTPATARLSAEERAYVQKVRQAGDQAGLPYGCLAVDGAHIYEARSEDRARNRAIAYRWLEAAAILGATQVRIDSGGPKEMTDAVLAVIVEGYKDVVQRAQRHGLQVLMENHWGASHVPGNLVKILDAVPGLGLLFDSFNWDYTHQGEGWLTCAKYAQATHIKTFQFTADGEELTQNIKNCIGLLQDGGYTGPWGVESCPTQIDEYEGAKKTIELIRRYVK